jgi:hypothetical protein
VQASEHCCPQPRGYTSWRAMWCRECKSSCLTSSCACVHRSAARRASSALVSITFHMAIVGMQTAAWCGAVHRSVDRHIHDCCVAAYFECQSITTNTHDAPGPTPTAMQFGHVHITPLNANTRCCRTCHGISSAAQTPNVTGCSPNAPLHTPLHH